MMPEYQAATYRIINRLDSLVDILHANTDPGNEPFQAATQLIRQADVQVREALRIADQEATRLLMAVHRREEGVLGEEAEAEFVNEAMAYNARKRGK